MMGRTHALTGWAAASLAFPLLSVTDLRLVVAVPLAAAGATLLPDLDSPSSTMSRSLGPVSGVLSRAVRWCSARVWAATATRYDRRDPRSDIGHRHLTHTVPACVVFGVVAWLAVVGVGAGLGRVVPQVPGQVLGAVAAGLVCGALAVPAARYVLQAVPGVGFRDASRGAPVVGVVVAVLAGWGQVPPVVVGVVVGVGALVGVLGDWFTPHGVPLLWPVVFQGKRWWMHRFVWTFATDEDSRAEKVVRRACGFAGVASWVLLVPVW